MWIANHEAYFDILRDECISKITRISCLLAYYDFELSATYKEYFQTSKLLFYTGSDNALWQVLYMLHDIEETLLAVIWEFYKPFWNQDK